MAKNIFTELVKYIAKFCSKTISQGRMPISATMPTSGLPNAAKLTTIRETLTKTCITTRPEMPPLMKGSPNKVKASLCGNAELKTMSH